MDSIQVKKLKTLTGHKDCLYTMSRYSETKFLSAGGDGMVVLWDLENLEEGLGQLIVKVPSSIYAMAYESRRNLLVVGQNFSGIHLIDVEEKKEVGSLSLTSKAIFDIKTTDEAIFITTGDGEVMKVSWELQILNRVQSSDKSGRCIALNPDTDQLAIGFSDQCIRIYDMADLRHVHEFKAHDLSVFGLNYHPQLPLLISVSRDARIKSWDVDQNFQLVDEVVGHMYAVNHLYFSPSGKYFATCSMDKSVKIWDSNSFKLLKVIDRGRHAGHATSVNRLLWMNYRDWLVSCSDDRSISIWEVLPQV